jgi:hypothetical protein
MGSWTGDGTADLELAREVTEHAPTRLLDRQDRAAATACRGAGRPPEIDHAGADHATVDCSWPARVQLRLRIAPDTRGVRYSARRHGCHGSDGYRTRRPAHRR